MPLADLDQLRAALYSTEPIQAALTALVAFHGLRIGTLCGLQLTDIRDGCIHLPDRVVLLAEPVRQRLQRWLDYRSHRWPDTLNPYLFINRTTAVRLSKISLGYVAIAIGMTPRKIREDRILHEALTCAGDIRRLCDLFGLSVKAVQRYTAILEHPDLAETPHQE